MFSSYKQESLFRTEVTQGNGTPRHAHGGGATVRSTFFRAALAALLAMALIATTSGGASAAPKVLAADPVDGTDWSCRPSAAHPDPVVMLHGLTGTSEGNWTYLAPQLVANGYCVFTLTYGRVSPDIDLGGMGPIAQSAQEV